MSVALICVHCGAPLPPPPLQGATTLTCPFCGVTNLLKSAPAVPRPLPQPARPQQPSSTNPAPFIIAGVVVMLGISGAITFLTARPAQRTMPVEVKPRPVSTWQPPPEPEKPRPPARWGTATRLQLDENGDVLALIGSQVFKLDGQSLEKKWHTAADPALNSFRAGVIVPRGERFAVVTETAIHFYDASSGEKSATWLYKDSGILERTCGAGTNQVLVELLGSQSGVWRFDVDTGKQVRGGGPSCALRESIQCGAGQWCGWRHFRSRTHECNYYVLVGKEMYRNCTTDDGTNRRVVVKMNSESGKVQWEAEAASVEDFFGVIDGVLVLGQDKAITALDPKTGAQVWQRAIDGRAVTSDGKRLFYGIDGTVEVAEAASGAVLQRLAPPE